MRFRISLLLYFAAICGACALAWLLPGLLVSVVSATTLGGCFTAIFAAIYVQELKQESIGSLYQSLAASTLRSGEQAAFNEEALGKIREIRRIFLLSNIVKLIGLMGAVYLSAEKNPVLPVELPLRLVIFCFCIALLFFARLWFEVSAAERLLISIKTQSMLQQRREAFMHDSTAANVHDFKSDPVVESFGAAPTEMAWSDLKITS